MRRNRPTALLVTELLQPGRSWTIEQFTITSQEMWTYGTVSYSGH